MLIYVSIISGVPAKSGYTRTKGMVVAKRKSRRTLRTVSTMFPAFSTAELAAPAAARKLNTKKALRLTPKTEPRNGWARIGGKNSSDLNLFFPRKPAKFVFMLYCLCKTVIFFREDGSLFS